MEFLYLLTTIILIISFMLIKKKNEKINFIKWLIISVVTLYGYNIFLGMLLGLLNITSHMLLLSIINIVAASLISYKSIKNKDFQKYFVRKIDLSFTVIVLILFAVMFVKDLYIFKGDITHNAMDSAVHYRAAKHYAENLKIFINVEDKTFFNFNVMQTGAYINDGLFMRVVHKITNLDYLYIFQIFETILLYLSGLAFLASFIDKIKTKKGLVGSFVAFVLYIYGYPYNSWTFGFSYLSVGIMFTAMLIPVLDSLYNEFDKRIIIPVVILLAFGLIFSYCLFVPAIFSAICIYCMLKDLSNKNQKKYLKFFGLPTIIVTASLLVVTITGIGYLFIPTFFIEGQTNLISALKLGGEIYNERYRNFIAYIPFMILYAVEIFKKIKNKSLTYMDVFSIIMTGYWALLYIGNMKALVSEYYLIKTYYIMWIAVFSVTIDLINTYANVKNIRIDVVLIFALFIILYLNKMSASNIFKTYLFIFLIVFEVLPQLIKRINLEKIKFIPEKFKNIDIKPICITTVTYICIWGIFVGGWVWLKAGHIIGEAEKHSLINFVGIYYDENCEKRKELDLTSSFNKNMIALTTYARENLKDMTADNTYIVSEEVFNRIWAVAVTEINSEEIKYEDVIHNNHIFSIDEAVANNKKYFIKLANNEQPKQDSLKVILEEAEKNKNIKIIMKNENGFIAEVVE